MLLVGLTGGIGSGKSSVAALFEELGVPVVDADIVAREVVQPGEAGYQQVVDAFGPRAASAGDGPLDRAFLREHVFADPARRKRLEGILHPLIRSRIEQRLHRLCAPYCVVVVPLLLESGWQDLVERILVVDCPEETQLTRTMARDHHSEAQVRAIMAAQADRATRLAAADDIIENSGDLEYLRDQVRERHRVYLARAEVSDSRA